MDNEFKSLLLSKTFWGSLVTLGAAALSIAHYSLSAEDQATIVDIITGAFGAAGSLYAIYGRVVATKKIG